MESSVNSYLPIFLNVKGKKVLVVGGGTVGSKRALKFLELGADVTVISLDFSEELKSSHVKLIKSDAWSIDKDFLGKFDIIITATSDKALNSKICNLAKSLNRLCNNPTNPDESDFILPVYTVEDSIGVAVTTFGKSSLSSKYILSLIKERVLTEEVKRLVEVMGKAKEILKSEIDDPKKRFPLYSVIFNDEKLKEYVKNGEIEESIKRIEEIIHDNKAD